MLVENLKGQKGNRILNQFIITTDKGIYFQSYDSIIAFKPYTGKVILNKDYWDYSRTTGKYRNMFLEETKKETEKKIQSGEYLLTNLNWS